MSSKKTVASLVAGLALCLSGGVAANGIAADATEYIPADAGWLSVAPEIEPMGDGEYTLAFIGDTQAIARLYPESFTALADWLVEEREEMNLKFVVGAGDIVDGIGHTFETDPRLELEVAQSAYTTMLTGGVNFAFVLGNHDYADMAKYQRDMTLFSEYFTPRNMYEPQSTYAGAMDENSVENTYHCFTAGGTDYLVLALGHYPTDEMIAWGNSVIKANPTKKVIVVTHGYLQGDGNGTRVPKGDYLWENLVSLHENVAYVVCGHELGNGDGARITRSVDTGAHGNKVQQIMVNPAQLEYGGAGLVSLFRFRMDGSIDVNYYSPIMDRYYNAEAQFSFYENRPTGTPASAETTLGKTVSASFDDEFLSSSQGNIYAYNNVVFTEEGLKVASASSDGYIVYKFDCGETARFNTLKVGYTALFEPLSGTARSDGMTVSVSTDGVSYAETRRVDAVDQCAQSVSVPAGGYRKGMLDLNLRVRDRRVFYLKISFASGTENSSRIALLGFETNAAKTVSDYDENSFVYAYNFLGKTDWDTGALLDHAVYSRDFIVYDGYLGTGRAGDYAGAQACADFVFDAGEGRELYSLSFFVQGRLGYTGTVRAQDWFARLLVSTDGVAWREAAVETSSRSNYAETYDLSEYARGENVLYVRFMLWSNYWHASGLTAMTISGSYRYPVEYVVGDGVNGENNPAYYTGEETVTLSDASAPQYYTFLGWFDNADGKGEAITEISSGSVGARTLYAAYEPTRYAMNYEMNGGSCSDPDFYLQKNGLILSEPTRAGYEFAGWYSSADFAGDKVTEIEVGHSGDVTLYAEWLRLYRITYVLNGGELSEPVSSYTGAKEVILPVPVKTGYDFVGWFTDAAFTQKLEKIEVGDSGSLILYAQYKESAADGTSDSENVGTDSGSGASEGTGGCGSTIFSLAVAGVLLSGLALISVCKKRG